MKPFDVDSTGKLSGHTVGIAGIAYYQPAWSLPNAWYGPTMPRKFSQHTGIQSRSIAEEDEVEMAVRAVENLRKEHSLRANDCAGLILACPSLIPQSVARRYFDIDRAKQEQPTRVAHRLVDRLGLNPRQVVGINSFCSGYARAASLVLNKLDARRSLERNEYILIATSNRISRITDYGCQQSGALFGDLATVTLITRCDSSKYGVRFELIDACYRKQPATKPFFDFASRTEVLSPTRSGQRYLDSSRVVFTLDGMGIADTAPRAMASAAAAILDKNKLAPEDIQFVVPHQAGASIVRFTQMKLEELGVSAQVINGLTADIGNVSSSSLPFALKKSWASLRGNILCPVAAVGAPGKSEVSHGCVFLRSLRHLDSKAA